MPYGWTRNGSPTLSKRSPHGPVRHRQAKKLEKSFEAPDLLALARRANTQDSPALFDAVETTLSNASRYFSEYRQTHDADYLAELGLAGQALFVMANELSLRAGAPLAVDEPPPPLKSRQVKERRPSRPY